MKDHYEIKMNDRRRFVKTIKEYLNLYKTKWNGTVYIDRIAALNKIKKALDIQTQKEND